MLIFDLKNPQELIDCAGKGIPNNFRPSITIYPCASPYRSFLLRINNKTLEQSQEFLSAVNAETFSLDKFEKGVIDQLKKDNVANFEVHVSTADSNLLSIPFSAFYLEGIETASVTMREGGYGKSITVYHPESFSWQFRAEISKISRIAYSEHLIRSHIDAIKNGLFSWIIAPQEEECVISNIENFCALVKSDDFSVNFLPRKPLFWWEENSISCRRVIDFIIINRTSNHDLKIKINSLRKLS